MAIYADLPGKVVLITGGANGIGTAMVEAFAAQGATVCFCDIDPAGGAIAARLGENLHFDKIDLRNEAEIVRWCDRLAARWPRFDVLINNAASDPRQPLAQATTEFWDDLFARNLRACFLTCREALKRMQRGASIINFGSITFHLGPTPMTAYVATKGGILAFTRSLAREIGPRGIRANTLSPGWIMTERQLREFVNEETKALILRSQCIPELLQPSEIAGVALFLASDASGAITGQEILADRGWAHS